MVNSRKEAVTGKKFAHRSRTWSVAIGALLALGLMAPASYADDQPGGAEREALRHISEQIQELQVKLKELEARLNVTGSVPPEGADPSAVAPVGNVTPLPSTSLTPPLVAQEPEGENSIPGVKLRMFGDVGYEARDQKGSTNSFHIGTLDLLMTGVLTDHVSVLGELLFIPLNDNSIGVDIERLLLQYKHNDYFNVGIGRYHSSIGYYNTAFHHGAWFQTAVDRPFMYAFDDEGGFLPLQEVGLTVSGQIPSGSFGLNYVAEMGNGRAHLLGSDPAQNFRDTNNGKSFNLALHARPRGAPGLEVGFSIYHDKLTFSDSINHSELISTVYVVYENSKYEFLNEGMLVRHTGSMTGAPAVFHTPAFYTQFSRRFGKYRPYFRYSYVNAGIAEPIYGDAADGPIVGRRNGPAVGLRYDLNDHAAFKLQYDHLAQREQKPYNAIKAQFSFAF
jgi:hypothetical protein